MKSVINQDRAMKGKTEFASERLAEAYLHNQDDLFIKQIISIFKKQRIKPKFIHAIGGSDANEFNAHGIKTVVISSAHRNNHDLKEYLRISDLVKLADFLLRLVRT
ncbi:unnamed protein product [marine sediment metagenome]|uniref:Peptidase M20 dimerisation domain-containing protein n=1 Tax=marine sediment metagenome TaxID=412755 RepID=X1BIE7_9ZZZZ